MKRKYKNIRLFQNPILESLTHVHPTVPLIIWGPVSGWLIWSSLMIHEIPGFHIFGLGLGALLTWTLAEYVMHKYVFHFEATGPFMKKVVYLIHGNHHDEPMDPTRLVMPPAGAAILAAMFYGVFRFVLGPVLIEPFFAFFLIGYLWYDYTHFAIHHFTPSTKLGKRIKQNHMNHHFAHENKLWGVSSPLWDLVLGTYVSTRSPNRK